MRSGKKMAPEAKYDIAYQNLAYQRPSVGASAVAWNVAKLKFNTVLDVGCGMGYAVLGFLMAKKAVRGIEVSNYLLDNFLKVMKETGVVKYGRIQEIPYPSESYDLVYCTDVLEHIVEEDVDKAIEELVRVSKKYIFATVSTVPAVCCRELELHETVKPVEWWDEKWEKFRLKRLHTGIIRSTNEGVTYVWRKY